MIAKATTKQSYAKSWRLCRLINKCVDYDQRGKLIEQLFKEDYHVHVAANESLVARNWIELQTTISSKVHDIRTNRANDRIQTLPETDTVNNWKDEARFIILPDDGIYYVLLADVLVDEVIDDLVGSYAIIGKHESLDDAERQRAEFERMAFDACLTGSAAWAKWYEGYTDDAVTWYPMLPEHYDAYEQSDSDDPLPPVVESPDDDDPPPAPAGAAMDAVLLPPYADLDAETAEQVFEDFLTPQIMGLIRKRAWVADKNHINEPEDMVQEALMALWCDWVAGKTITKWSVANSSREASWFDKSNRRIRESKSILKDVEEGMPMSFFEPDDSDDAGDDVVSDLLAYSRGLRGRGLRGMNSVDALIDIEWAMDETVAALAIGQLFKRRVKTPTEKIIKRVEDIVEGYMYYREYGNRKLPGCTGRQGHLHKFWERQGHERGMMGKWKHRVFPLLANALAEYKPMSRSVICPSPARERSAAD